MKDRLTIIIAHRFSTIQNVDKILVIEDGIISQQGNPKELSEQPGVYKDLLTYQIQEMRSCSSSSVYTEVEVPTYPQFRVLL